MVKLKVYKFFPGNETDTITTTVTFSLPLQINYRYPYRYHFQQFLTVVTAVIGNYRYYRLQNTATDTLKIMLPLPLPSPFFRPVSFPENYMLYAYILYAFFLKIAQNNKAAHVKLINI